MTSVNRINPTGRRQPPRRIRKRRSFFQSTIKPLFFLVLFIAFLYAGGSFVYQKLSAPVVKYKNQSAEFRQAEIKNESVEKEIRELERQLTYADSEQGQILKARKYGWVLPGEVVYVLPNEGDTSVLDQQHE